MPNTQELLKELQGPGSLKLKLMELKKKNTILKIVMKGKQKVSHFDLGDLLRLF